MILQYFAVAFVFYGICSFSFIPFTLLIYMIAKTFHQIHQLGFLYSIESIILIFYVIPILRKTAKADSKCSLEMGWVQDRLMHPIANPMSNRAWYRIDLLKLEKLYMVSSAFLSALKTYFNVLLRKLELIRVTFVH